jgi:Flp pilus assembly protein TadB
MSYEPARPLIRRALVRAGALLIAAAAVLSFAVTGATAATSAPARAQAPTRQVMILLDVNSSKGWLAKAQQGAVAYLRALPKDVHAGLITFSTRWKLVQAPTADRASVLADVAAITLPGGRTSTGIQAALTGLSSVPGFGAPVSKALIITNAEGLSSTGNLTAFVPTYVLLPVVTTGSSQPSSLTNLAASSGGTLAQPQLVPTKHPPVGTCKFPKVCHDAQELAHNAFPQLGRAPAPKPTPKTQKPSVSVGARQSPAALIEGMAGVFGAVLILTLLVFGAMARTGKDRSLSSRIEKYGPRHKPARVKEPESDGSKVESAAVGAVTRVVSPAAQDRLAKRLELAGVARKPAEWILLAACLGVVVAATLSLVTSYVLLGVVAGVVISWLSMRLSLSLRILRRRARFADQLPELLQLIASALRSGFSLPQALDACVTEGTQPASAEFSRALAEVRVGVPLEDALDAVATRMDSDDLRWTIMAIRIQQGVGGNLAEVLLTIAGTIRERAFLRRQVQALSAEGRLSAYVLVALPLLVGTWLFISSPNYMRPLYTTSTGKLMLLGAGGLLVIGAVWMRRTIKVKV